MKNPPALDAIRTAFSVLNVEAVPLDHLAHRRADLWILDEDVFVDAAALLQMRHTLTGPAIVRASAATLETIQKELPLSDELCLWETPPVVLARLVRRLVARDTDTADALTGLLNRRAWLARVDADLATADAEQPFSTLLLDPERFEAINDRYGHLAGDRVLQEVSRRILETVPGARAIGRTGGAEFGLVIAAEEGEAVQIAETLRERLMATPFLDGISLTVNLGIATAHRAEAYRDILRQADAALFVSKTRGKSVHFNQLAQEFPESGGSGERVIRRLFRDLRRQLDLDLKLEIYNRPFLDRQLPREASEAARRGTPLSLAMVDIDHFRAVNSEHLWQTGDLVLKEIASKLREGARRRGWVARYGGEEFCIVFPGIPLVDACQLLEAIRAAVAAQSFTSIDGRNFPVTFSAGVAELMAGEDFTKLLARASGHLRTSKQSGRNRVIC